MATDERSGSATSTITSRGDELKKRYLRRARALGKRKVNVTTSSSLEYMRVPSPVFDDHVTLPLPLVQSTPTQNNPTHIGPKNTSDTLKQPPTNKISMSQLENQLSHLADMNRELKRLLMASIGNDLEVQVQQIVHDKVQLAHDLDASVTKITEYHEELDELVVECDVWRSKFLASRVLIEELSSWRNVLVSKYENCHQALTGLLKERDVLCRDMILCQESLRQALQLIGEINEVKGRAKCMTEQNRPKVATVSPIQLSEKGSHKASLENHTTLDIARDTRDTAMCVLKRAQAMAVNTPMMGGAKRESKTCDQETRRKLVASVPTAGEHLAQEVLQQGLTPTHLPSHSSSIPHLSFSEQHLLFQRRPDTSCSSLSYMPSVLMTRDLLNPPFHCACCRGKIMIV